MMIFLRPECCGNTPPLGRHQFKTTHTQKKTYLQSPRETGCNQMDPALNPTVAVCNKTPWALIMKDNLLFPGMVILTHTSHSPWTRQFHRWMSRFSQETMILHAASVIFTGFTVHAGFMICPVAVSTGAARLGLEAFRPLSPPPTLKANWNSISSYKISLMASFFWVVFLHTVSISRSQTPLSNFHRNEQGAIIQHRRSRGFIERSTVWSGLHKTAIVLLSPYGISGLLETWLTPQALVVFVLSPF